LRKISVGNIHRRALSGEQIIHLLRKKTRAQIRVHGGDYVGIQMIGTIQKLLLIAAPEDSRGNGELEIEHKGTTYGSLNHIDYVLSFYKDHAFCSLD
jgi:hypothetical protein